MSMSNEHDVSNSIAVCEILKLFQAKLHKLLCISCDGWTSYPARAFVKFSLTAILFKMFNAMMKVTHAHKYTNGVEWKAFRQHC